MRASRLGLHDIAAEIVRRAPASCVVRLSTPPKSDERMRLLAARLERQPFVIMPHKCTSIEEWIASYGELEDASEVPRRAGEGGR